MNRFCHPIWAVLSTAFLLIAADKMWEVQPPVQEPGSNPTAAALIQKRMGPSCDLGFDVYLYNSSASHKIAVTIKVVTHDGLETSERITSTYVVDSFRESFLGCETPGDGTRVDFYVNSSAFALLAPNGDAILVAALSPQMLAAAFDSSGPVIADCRLYCGQLGPKCLILTSKVEQRFRRGLAWLGDQLLTTEDQVVTQAALVAAFSLSASEVTVDRSDTAVTDWWIQNSGPACSLRVALPQAGTLELSVPSLLAGVIDRASATNGAFVPSSEPIRLLFSDNGLQTRWGGDITEIRYYDGALYARTPNACLMIATR